MLAVNLQKGHEIFQWWWEVMVWSLPASLSKNGEGGSEEENVSEPEKDLLLAFEEQDKLASASGSCMSKLQHELADLTKSASHGSYDSKAPLAFSICTEGPHIELWAHYTTSQKNVRMYNMNILKTCQGSLAEGVTEFLMVVDSMISWASVDFVNDIAEQLVLVESAGRA
jgi:hypothetical protein